MREYDDEANDAKRKWKTICEGMGNNERGRERTAKFTLRKLYENNLVRNVMKAYK